MLKAYRVKVQGAKDYIITEEGLLQVFGDKLSMHIVKNDDVKTIVVHTEEDGDILIEKVVVS